MDLQNAEKCFKGRSHGLFASYSNLRILSLDCY